MWMSSILKWFKEKPLNSLKNVRFQSHYMMRFRVSTTWMAAGTGIRVTGLNFCGFGGHFTIIGQCFWCDVYTLHSSYLLTFPTRFGTLQRHKLKFVWSCCHSTDVPSIKLISTGTSFKEKPWLFIFRTSHLITVLHGPCFHARHLGRRHGCTVGGFWSGSQSELSEQTTSRTCTASPQVAEHCS